MFMNYCFLQCQSLTITSPWETSLPRLKLTRRNKWTMWVRGPLWYHIHHPHMLLQFGLELWPHCFFLIASRHYSWVCSCFCSTGWCILMRIPEWALGHKALVQKPTLVRDFFTNQEVFISLKRHMKYRDNSNLNITIFVAGSPQP